MRWVSLGKFKPPPPHPKWWRTWGLEAEEREQKQARCLPQLLPIPTVGFITNRSKGIYKNQSCWPKPLCIRLPRYERKTPKSEESFLKALSRPDSHTDSCLFFILCTSPRAQSSRFCRQKAFHSSPFQCHHRYSSLRPPDSCQAGAPAAIFTTRWAHSCQGHLPHRLLSPAQTSTHFSSDRTALDTACLTHPKPRVLQMEDTPARESS